MFHDEKRKPEILNRLILVSEKLKDFIFVKEKLLREKKECYSDFTNIELCEM